MWLTYSKTGMPTHYVTTDTHRCKQSHSKVTYTNFPARPIRIDRNFNVSAIRIWSTLAGQLVSYNLDAHLSSQMQRMLQAEGKQYTELQWVKPDSRPIWIVANAALREEWCKLCDKILSLYLWRLQTVQRKTADPVEEIKPQLNLISLYIIQHASHTLAAKATVCVLCEVSAVAEQTIVHSEYITQQWRIKQQNYNRRD